MNYNNNLIFLVSALSVSGCNQSIDDVIEWIKHQNEKINLSIKKVPFSYLKEWEFSAKNRNLRHKTGKFFSIDGIEVKTNWNGFTSWSQPIINQPEVGYLGFITKEFRGVLHFLVQAKIEPGNINHVQLSPTVQATKSNYTQVHRGNKPKYLDYFIKASKNQIVLDQLQSEQGARFLSKRNRNIIIKIEEDIIVEDNFIWLTLGQIKELMKIDNLVNMDTRTVISGISYGNFTKKEFEFIKIINLNIAENSLSRKFLISTLVINNSLHSNVELISWITQKKFNHQLEIKLVSLASLKEWLIGNNSIEHSEKKYFKVIGVEVLIENREVTNWTQPMIEPVQTGLCAFVCKEINGILHLAVQAKLECGNYDIIELAPTVQCLTDNYKNSINGKLPFLDFVLNSTKDQIVYDSLQSEEGGRFYREENRNMIVIAGKEINLKLPKDYIWMTLNQLQTFVTYNNYLNIQARNLLSAISFIK